MIFSTAEDLAARGIPRRLRMEISARSRANVNRAAKSVTLMLVECDALRREIATSKRFILPFTLPTFGDFP